MRRLNATIKVDFISEKGFDSSDKTYFAYIPLENMVCYAVAESCDNYSNENSAEIAVKSVLGAFERNPSLKNLKKYIKSAHYALREKRLEAAITVVVSDYTRIRYASCGNVKFYLLNNDAIELESKTHDYVYKNTDSVNYSLGTEPFHELRNLSQYLGQPRPIKPFISTKIELPEGCTMLFATVNIWEALDDVEILDAYTNSENFIDCVQALYIPTEHKASSVGSYTLASLFVEKPFKEDNIKKKKHRRIMIITIIITIIVLIIFSIIYYLDNRAVSRIRDLDNKAVEHFDYGRFDMVFEQYDEAAAKINTIGKKWLNKEEKYVLRTTLPQMKDLFYHIIRGDEEFENGRYEESYNFYMEAEELRFNLSKNADLNLMFAPKMLDMRDQIETHTKARLERTGKYVATVRFLKEISDMIADERYPEAMNKIREAEIHVANIDNLEHRDLLRERINKERQKIAAWVEAKGLTAEEKASSGSFAEAIIIYEEMRQLFTELGEISKASEIRNKIDDVNSEKRAIEDGISVETAEAYIKNGDDFFAVNDFESAISYYNLARNLYTALRMNEAIAIVNEKIIEIQVQRAEMELMTGVLAAQTLESEGDVFLASGHYDEARNRYRQAQAAYQVLNQLDKVVALQDKINNVNDIEIAEQVSIAENEKKLLVTEGQYFEHEGDNFVQDGDLIRAMESYNKAWEFYLSAGDVDSALAALLKLREAERKKQAGEENQQIDEVAGEEHIGEKSNEQIEEKDNLQAAEY